MMFHRHMHGSCGPRAVAAPGGVGALAQGMGGTDPRNVRVSQSEHTCEVQSR